MYMIKQFTLIEGLPSFCSGPSQRLSTVCVQRSHGWPSSALPASSTCTLADVCWPSWRSWRRMTGSWRCSTTRWEEKLTHLWHPGYLPLILFNWQTSHCKEVIFISDVSGSQETEYLIKHIYFKNTCSYCLYVQSDYRLGRFALIRQLAVENLI